MSKTAKKLLAILLSVCMLSGVFCVSAFAVTKEDASTDPNYTVLILDTVDRFYLQSGGSIIYTVPTSIEVVKTAATAFVEQIFSNPSANNYVAIVTCGRSAVVASNFSNDEAALLNVISRLTSTPYGSNFNQALLKADSLLSSVSVSNHKNVVMFMPETPSYGEYSTSGHYSISDSEWKNIDTGIYYYAYANVIHNTISTLSKKYSIFTIGLFTMLEDVPAEGQPYVEFAKQCAEDFQNAGYFEANDPEKLKDEFKDVANFIVEEQMNNGSGILDIIRECIILIFNLIFGFFL